MMLNEGVEDLLSKSRWTDPTDLYIGEIVEYDMKDGGLSIIKEENLLPLKEIKKIEAIPKGIERDMYVGKLRYSKDASIRNIAKKQEKLFSKYRIMFGNANDLEVSDIFSIKRDAVFLKRYANQTEFGNYINFREKHRYDIYILLGKDELKTNLQSRHRTYEVYYNTFSDEISIKGIKDENINAYHMNGLVPVIKKYLRHISRFDYYAATKYIVDIIDDYKCHRLPIDCYREFNDESDFKFQIDGKTFGTMDANIEMIEHIDVRYNFNHILVPMLNLASLGINRKNR
jgi:hypothetical protein